MTNTKYNGTLNISQYFITIDINVPYSKILLENAFPLLTVKQIEKPWHENHYRYAPTWKFLKSQLTKDEAGQVTSTTMKLLKKARKSKWQPALVPELQREKQFVQRSERMWCIIRNALSNAIILDKEMEEKDRKLAEELNEKEYEETGQGIECGCCCCEYPFDEMVQCLEGHLFCKNCLKKYVEESVFGQGQIDVHCMDGSGCKSTFPMSQLRRCLPEQMLNKIMNRMQELEIMKVRGLQTCQLLFNSPLQSGWHRKHLSMSVLRL
jgi:hypothetical protein